MTLPFPNEIARLRAPKPTDMLHEIMGHLGAAVSQSSPSDDQIIMDHVKAAHELVTLLWRAQRDEQR